MKKKRIIRTGILAVIVFALVLFSGYTCLFSRTHYSFTRMNYSNGLLPEGFKNFKIVDLSDIHINTSKDINRLEQMVDEIEDQNYDMVVFTGDLYEGKPIEDARVQKILKKLQPGYGKFAVLGDEDHARADEVTNILNEGGFEVLNNSARTIHYRNSSFILYGQAINSQEEIPSSDGFVLTLSHYPDSFTQNKGRTHLQLSGHSNGGTIWFPGIGPLVKCKNAITYNHGSYAESGSELIVSNGVAPRKNYHFKVLCENEIIMITFE